MQGTRSRVASGAPSTLASVNNAEVVKTITSLLRRLCWARIARCIMLFLVAVETSDIGWIPACSSGSAGGFGVFLSLLVISATFLLFLLPSLLIGGLAILGLREIWVRGAWGLVLSLFGRLVLRMPSGRGLVSRIPSS